MKQKVMEALLDSNHNLTKQEILWAASHLPDGKDKGQHKTVVSTGEYNHDTDDLFLAIGCDKSDALKTAEVLGDVTKKILVEKDYKISAGIQEIMEKGQEITGFFPLIVSKLLKDTIDKVEEQHRAKNDLMNLLKKLKGDLSEDDE